MTDFFRFPRTPHLLWLGSGKPRDDKLLAPSEASELLSDPVIVEEKVDGANVGITLDGADLRVQNRGDYLSWDYLHPQFKPLPRWLAIHRVPLVDALGPDLILFGEWCYAKHSIRYTRLPDWFLAFDVYDRTVGSFWSVKRRNALVNMLGLVTVPEISRGKFSLSNIQRLLGPSRLSDGLSEGIYVRREEGDFLQSRAKLVRAEFTQAMGEHWTRTTMKLNELEKRGRTATAR